MITALINDLVLGVAHLLGEAQVRAPEAFRAADGAADRDDEFRKAVWIAYGAVLVLLAAYSLFVMIQNRAVARRLDHLGERFERFRGKGGGGGAGAASDAGD